MMVERGKSGRINLLRSPRQRHVPALLGSAYELHTAYPGTKIPTSCVLKMRNHQKEYAELVNDVMIELLHPVADPLQAIIGDNIKELANHERIT